MPPDPAPKNFFIDLGDRPTVKGFCERVQAIFKKSLGPDHPNTVKVRNNLVALKN
jgi:hypothetical protein